jgi:hypothetical protein
MRYPLQEAEDYYDEPPIDEHVVQVEEMLEAERRYQDYLAEQQAVHAPTLVPCTENDYMRDRTKNVTQRDVARLQKSYGCTGRVGLYMKDGFAIMYTIKVGHKGTPLLRRFGRGYRGVMCELVAIVNLNTGIVERPNIPDGSRFVLTKNEGIRLLVRQGGPTTLATRRPRVKTSRQAITSHRRVSL